MAAITSCEIRRLFRAAWEIRRRKIYEKIWEEIWPMVWRSARNGKSLSRPVKGRFVETIYHSSSLHLLSVPLFLFSLSGTGFLAFLLTRNTPPTPPGVGFDYQSSRALCQAVKTNNSVPITLRPIVLSHSWRQYRWH